MTNSTGAERAPMTPTTPEEVQSTADALEARIARAEEMTTEIRRMVEELAARPAARITGTTEERFELLEGAVADLRQAGDTRSAATRHLVSAMRAAAGALDVPRDLAQQKGPEVPTGGTSATAPFDDLVRTVRELRADFEHLRRSLAEEVRTRRVVVVDKGRTTRVDPGYISLEGNPSCGSAITLQAGADGAEVRLYSGPEERMEDHPHSTALSLYAAPGWVEDRATGDGQARITFYAGSEEQHVISTDGHPTTPPPPPAVEGEEEASPGATVTVPETLERRTGAAVVKALDLLDEVGYVVWELDRLDHTVTVVSATETVLDVDEAALEMSKAAGTWHLRDLVQAIAETVMASTASIGGEIPSYDERKALRERFSPAAARHSEVEDAQRRWRREGRS